ncbi:unnamed protein product [Lathyrus sativus]|nr:unnamed protein product [Lathyrus sativus]
MRHGGFKNVDEFEVIAHQEIHLAVAPRIRSNSTMPSQCQYSCKAVLSSNYFSMNLLIFHHDIAYTSNLANV